MARLSFSCLTLLLQFFVLFHTISAQTTTPRPITEDRVTELFDEYMNDGKWRDSIDFEKEINDYIDEIDFAQEFKDRVGISIGGVITIIIVVIIIPNLVIMGLIFLCCYCCRCGAFYRGSHSDIEQSQTLVSPPLYGASGGYKPEVPARPSSQSRFNKGPESPQPQSVWPWNRNQNQTGFQNEGYKPDY